MRQVPFSALDHHVPDAPATVTVIGGPMEVPAELAVGGEVGVDRLVALFADTPDIADTLFFPVGEMFD